MITQFVCDNCKMQRLGQPRGYDGDLCQNCWVDSELHYHRSLIAGKRETIKRLFSEIETELEAMDNLMEQRV